MSPAQGDAAGGLSGDAAERSDGRVIPAPLDGIEPLAFHSIPAEDPATYDMICKADTVGVFQIESRAQMSMLPRLKPRCFYDLVIEVAIVRPGPIQGDMVHPYLRRRSGQEPAVHPDAAIEKVLGKTLGVPLFQEQAMALAVVAAGFTAGQADELRRAIAAWKRSGNKIAQFGEALEAGMVARGYSQQFAAQVFEQIKGFSGYGFPESHAASFAHLVYASAWLKRHHPAAFAAALLNSQPMGFYAPPQILRDAKDHGVAVRGIDVQCSLWDTTLERGPDPCRSLVGACREKACTIRVDGSGLEPRLSRIDHGEGLPHRWHDVDTPVEDAPSGQDGVFRRVHSRGRSIGPRSMVDRTRQEPAVGRRAEPLCPPEKSVAQGECIDARIRHGAQPAIRLGLRMVRGLEPEEAQQVVDAVTKHGPFRRIADLADASRLTRATLRKLAAADAFGSMALDRQQATWQILALRDSERPLWSFGMVSQDGMDSASIPQNRGPGAGVDEPVSEQVERRPVAAGPPGSGKATGSTRRTSSPRCRRLPNSRRLRATSSQPASLSNVIRSPACVRPFKGRARFHAPHFAMSDGLRRGNRYAWPASSWCGSAPGPRRESCS